MSTRADLIGKKRAVIFDFFHTLTGPESAWGDGRPMTHAMLGVTREAWNEQLLEKSRERMAGKLRDPFTIIAGMARAINPAISDEVIRAAMENRLARFDAAVVRIPDETQRVLRALKAQGKLIGLIGNADVTEIAAWDRSPIAPLFDSVIFSCYAGWVKPEPEIYRQSLAELGVTPEEAVFVGDGACNELQGARNVGITAVMFTGVIREAWPEKIAERRPQADFAIDHLHELLPE